MSGFNEGIYNLDGNTLTVNSPEELSLPISYIDGLETALLGCVQKSDTRIAKMTATQASTSTTLVDVTELILPLEANSVYEVDCFVIFKSVATTTGLTLGYTSPTDCLCNTQIIIPTSYNTSTQTSFPCTIYTPSVFTGSLYSGSISHANSNFSAIVRGIAQTGATDGNFRIRFASEVAESAVTLQIGSILKITKVA